MSQSPPTADIRSYYLRCRTTAASPADALERAVEMGLDQGLDQAAVYKLARDGDWEGEYVRTRLLVAPPADQDDMGGLASDVQRLRSAALDAHEDSVSGGSRSEWVQVERLYHDVRKQYVRERLDQEKLDQDRKHAEEWAAEARALQAELEAEYAGRGVQYRVLCMGLAPLVIKLNKSYAGGIRLTTPEQTDLSRTISGMVAQLQKHTESTKTEGTQVIKAAVVSVLKVIEPHLSQQPHLWQRILSDVEAEYKEVPALPAGHALD